MLEVTAPAKINLTLEVLYRREDGYHEIMSIIQAMSLADRIQVEAADSFTYSCNNSLWRPEKSLVPKAAGLFTEYTGIAGGAAINVCKAIPFSAGLGGESSAAAATLVALNCLFGTDLPPGEIHKLAVKLGSDVPFFLSGGTALLLGRGEKVSPLPPVPPHRVVLLVPEHMRADFKTQRMFSVLRKEHFTDGQATDEMIVRLTLAKQDQLYGLFNAFDNVAFEVFEGLSYYRQELLEAGAKDVHLAGAGPALFTLEADRGRAESICSCLKSRGLQALMAETVTTGASSS